MPACMSYTSSARRSGRQTSSRVRGISKPKARSMALPRVFDARPIERLFDIDVGPEQCLDRQRDLDRNVEPFKESRPRQWKIVGVALAFLHRRALEDDDDTGLVCSRIVLSDDAGFPKPPHVGDFFGQKRFNGR